MDQKKTDDLENMFEDTGEDIMDEPDLEVVEQTHQSKIKSLQVKLKVAQQEKAEQLENLQRAKAVFLNARKRLEEEAKMNKERVINDCIERLLPLCDSFSLAMGNTTAWEAVDSAWRQGVASIASQLKSILQGYGVTEFGSSGETFDPELHEAVGNTPVEDSSAVDTVLQVILPGYRRSVGDTTVIIRPARVIVGINK